MKTLVLAQNGDFEVDRSGAEVLVQDARSDLSSLVAALFEEGYVPQTILSAPEGASGDSADIIQEAFAGAGQSDFSAQHVDVLRFQALANALFVDVLNNSNHEDSTVLVVSYYTKLNQIAYDLGLDLGLHVDDGSRSLEAGQAVILQQDVESWSEFKAPEFVEKITPDYQ